MFINVNSSSRAQGQDSDFWINLSANIPNNFSKIRLHAVQFYRSFYNVTSSESVNDARSNNMLSFSVGLDLGSAVDLVCSIPQGDYDVTTLIAALQTAINDVLTTESIPATVTITINNLLTKLVFSIDGGYSIKINNVYDLQDTYSNIGLNLLIGFARRSDSAFGTSITGSRSFNMNRYLVLMLQTNIISTNSASFSTVNTPFVTPTPTSNVDRVRMLDIIPINGGPNDLISYVNNNTAWQNLTSLAGTSQMLFRFRTQDDDQINFQGQLANIVLEVL